MDWWRDTPVGLLLNLVGSDGTQLDRGLASRSLQDNDAKQTQLS